MNFYLNKYGFQPPKLNKSPSDELYISIVIPCFDEPDLISSLQSIENCNRPNCDVEVIVVLNSGEHHTVEIKNQNSHTERQFKAWKSKLNSDIEYHLIHESNLPKKHAGVGLARKIGMDEAVARFDSLNKDGIIACYDADSRCDQNYLIAIEEHFTQHSNSPGCSIHFEHPLEGTEFDKEIYDAIINYELHLRYYKQCQEFMNLPYAFHTIGSSMAVRSSTYQKQGGMNKRKAGEDFYFIHKIVALGDYSELNTTRVIPSPRISARVPFGTGKAVGEWVKDQTENYLTYNFEIFKQIKNELSKLKAVYEDDYALDLPLISKQQTDEIIEHTSDYEPFRKRFFQWFDAFKLLKVVHYYRDNGYPNQPLFHSTHQLDKAMNRSKSAQDLREQLEIYRKIDSKN